MASPSSRPIISAHKPAVTDQQMVASAGANLRSRAASPDAKRPLMQGRTKISLTPVHEDLEVPSAPAIPVSAARKITAVEPVNEPVANPIAEEQPAPQPKPDKVKVSVDTSSEGAVTVTSAPKVPAAIAKTVTIADAQAAAEPAADPIAVLRKTAPAVSDTPTVDTSKYRPATEIPISAPALQTEEEPVGWVADEEPEQIAPQPEVRNETPPTEEVSDEPDYAAPIAAKHLTSREDIMSGAGMTMPLDEEPRLAPVVSHHKHKMRWWQWLIVLLLIVVLGVAAFNFLLDAELVKTELDLPHTELL